MGQGKRLVMLLFSIPSPEQGVWMLGPVPLRAYALFIIIGIVVAIKWGSVRWQKVGGGPEDIADIAMYAVPAGIVGGRLYHVMSDWQIYFGDDGRGFVAALRVWDGGLGIWGAIALGFAGAAYAARKRGFNVTQLADALAPGVAVAQGIGRIGNWFNQELFGAPTSLPWGLQIGTANRPAGYEEFVTFHPTFLYEMLWVFAAAAVLIWAERKYQLVNGQVFALYIALYCSGRGWIEMLRIDAANQILGLRLNVFTSIIIGLGALIWFLWSRRSTKSRSV